jgi:hypothetical protein
MGVYSGGLRREGLCRERTVKQASGNGDARNRTIVGTIRIGASANKGSGTKTANSARPRTISTPGAEYVPRKVFSPLTFI